MLLNRWETCSYRLLFMIVPILVFFSLCSSFARVGDIRQLSKWAGKIVGWFVITTPNRFCYRNYSWFNLET